MSTGSSSSGSSSLDTLTLVGRLRGTRGLSLFILLCALALGVLVRQAIFVRAEVSTADVGFVTSPGASGRAVVGGLTSAWEGLRDGDELVAAAGKAVDFDGWQVLRRTLLPGPLALNVLRDGEGVALSGTVEPPSPSYAFALVVRLVTGAMLFLIGVGSFLMRPGGKTSWLFLLLMLLVGVLASLTGGNAGFLSGIYRVIVLALTLAPGVGLHLFAVFPEPIAWARKSWVEWAFHVPGAVFATLFVVGWIQGTDVTTPGKLGLELVVRLWAIVATVGTVVIIGRQWRRHARAGNHRVASLYRVLALALAVGLLAPAVLTTLARAFALGPLLGQLSSAGIIAFALLMGSVLVRHNPLEIDRYAASVVGYVLAVGFLGGAFALALVALPLVLNKLGVASSSEALVVLTAATFLSVGPAYRRLGKVVDRWFSQEQANALQTSEMLRRVVEAVQQQTREQALEVVLDAASVLGGAQVALWQVDASGRNFYRALARGGDAEASPVPREGPFGRTLERACGVARLAPITSAPETQQALWDVGLAMAAPVRAHGVPMAVLGVGRRASGFAYRAEDLAFVETLASQAGLALERGQVVTQIGRYRVERRLAAGGMAEIFVAWQLGPGGFERKVALKRLLPEFSEDPRYAAGLLDEARIAARLHHRNIAQTYEVGLEQGQHFIAMEFVDGPPLRTLIAVARRTERPVPVPVALAVARALLGALHHAHEVTDASGHSLGVVHRDVTPSNVLVSRDGEAKLVDFGLVLANTRLFRTQTGVARGTLPYMSPEQGGGQAVDRRSDVYSAGATLYELFTGVRAFPEGPLGPAPAPATQARPGLPAALDAVFRTAVAGDAGGRYPTAEAFARALSAAAGVEPATEAQVSLWMRELGAESVEAAPVSKDEVRTSTVDSPPSQAP